METRLKEAIPFGEMTSQFDSKLNEAPKSRFIFSGPYGSGKTYFLRKFFETNTEKYEVFHLYPVNYHIADNNDIFDLIKVDLLYCLLEKGIAPEDAEISGRLIVQFYLLHKGPKILLDLLQIHPNLSKVESAINFVKKLIGDYKNYNQSVEKANADILDLILDDLLTKNKLLELDALTEFIQTSLKGFEPPKKTILIIDDLDRVDPEHVFRLLNVFAAHWDRSGSTDNKFGFDQIILVCDIINIKQIYLNKFGQCVDFDGYIDKFYTIGIFEFSIISEISKKITILLNNFNCNFPYNQEELSQYQKHILFILRCFLNVKAINIRDIEMFSCKTTYTNISSTKSINRKRATCYRIVVAFDILMNIFPNSCRLKSSFEKCMNSDANKKYDSIDTSSIKFYLLNAAFMLSNTNANGDGQSDSYTLDDNTIQFKSAQTIHGNYSVDFIFPNLYTDNEMVNTKMAFKWVATAFESYLNLL